MQVAPLYRTLLKELKEASITRPHFLYELRYLLSLPVSFDGPYISSSSSGANSPSPSSASTDPLLQRPSTECWKPDLSPEELFTLCKTDLRQIIDENSAAGTASVAASVGRQVSGLRELTWLENRLRATVSDATKAALDLAVSVSAGPGEDDFIPDTAFAKAEIDDQTRFAVSQHGAASSSFTEVDEEKLNQFQLEATPGGTFAMVDEKHSPRGASDEHDPSRLYSAGAVGLHREMFVLRRRDAAFLPMRRYFLHGLDGGTHQASGTTSTTTAEDSHHTRPSATADTRGMSSTSFGAGASALSQAKVAEMAVTHTPTVRISRNGEVKLTVAVHPFDEEYVNRSQAGIGYFESAHRQFMVRFQLECLGQQQQALRVVNTQFIRLDMALSELVEETGFLHSWDVKHMIQERDGAMGIVSQVAHLSSGGVDGDDHLHVREAEHSAVVTDEIRAATEGADATGELRRSDVRAVATGPSESIPAAEDETTAAHRARAAGQTAMAHATRDFALAFVTDSDGASVMKGLVYYQAAVTEEALVATPIHVISFSHVLMNP